MLQNGNRRIRRKGQFVNLSDDLGQSAFLLDPSGTPRSAGSPRSLKAVAALCMSKDNRCCNIKGRRSPYRYSPPGGHARDSGKAEQHAGRVSTRSGNRRNVGTSIKGGTADTQAEYRASFLRTCNEESELIGWVRRKLQKIVWSKPKMCQMADVLNFGVFISYLAMVMGNRRRRR
jgi:hypothetical protein